MSDDAQPADAADAGDDPVKASAGISRGSPTRVGPLLMGATFICIGVVSLAVNPDGFDETAILLWPVVIGLLLVGTLLAVVGHFATRRR